MRDVTNMIDSSDLVDNFMDQTTLVMSYCFSVFGVLSPTKL